MNAFTIRDLENLSGIKAHTIRIWEQRYSFLKPRRTQTNIRHYDSEELKTLLNVALLNKNGYRVSSIDKMTPDEISEKILSLTSTSARHDMLINDMLKQMIDLNPNEFEKIIDRYVDTNGIESTIVSLIFPFLNKVGILWMTNHVRVAQEHLVSNIVRQKLIKGIEEVKVDNTNGKTVVLFLPDGEYHELGLLYVQYLLKLKGRDTIYLGADVPVEELAYVCNTKQPGILYTHLTSLPAKFNFEKYLIHLRQNTNNTPLVISGRVTHQYAKKIPAGVTFGKTLDEVIFHLAA
ncbi:MAG: MerR family transcriptional regulator [Chitinophagaceae bacterium]|nr:MerR family transcriptional regulator [Chitinophagaceae bacterium]